MPVNKNSSKRKDEFLRELERMGVEPIRYRRETYMVNDMRVSIRTTTKPGPKFWYDVSKAIIESVEYFIYQTDSPCHFVLFPSSFLKEHYSRLQDSNRLNAKQFYIHWSRKTLQLDSGLPLDIEKYCCSTQPGEEAGSWQRILVR